MYPRKRVIHLFLDNARYHHAKLVQAWLARPGCRIKLHFVPTYCPHLDPIERLLGLMHKHITHNRRHETFSDFINAILTFLREKVPRNWRLYRDEVTDNVRIISPNGLLVLPERGYHEPAVALYPTASVRLGDQRDIRRALQMSRHPLTIIAISLINAHRARLASHAER
jgi:DDE superfamily endonuclease